MALGADREDERRDAGESAGLLAAVRSPAESFCTACWTGDYRVPPAGEDRAQPSLFPREGDGR